MPHTPAGKRPDYDAASAGIARVLKIIGGRWKLLILFELFPGRPRRFSELERALPGVSQKMLTQQLRQLEEDGLVHRQIYPEVPPRVEYSLTDWGQSLCPQLDGLLAWQEARPERPPEEA
nr:helix-turn-helix domain-containing protein [Pseudoroseicyclus tamaricis]